MSAIQLLATVLVGYSGIVVAFACMVATMGKRQESRGVQPGEDWLTITTTGAEGSRDSVVAGVESGGRLYAAANHWPRSWYNGVIENPDVEITRAGDKAAYRAMSVVGEERIRIARYCSLE
jgi:hypothetical protein